MSKVQSPLSRLTLDFGPWTLDMTSKGPAAPGKHAGEE
jgi:hypothetical protein